MSSDIVGYVLMESPSLNLNRASQNRYNKSQTVGFIWHISLTQQTHINFTVCGRKNGLISAHSRIFRSVSRKNGFEALIVVFWICKSQYF